MGSVVQSVCPFLRSSPLQRTRLAAQLSRLALVESHGRLRLRLGAVGDDEAQRDDGVGVRHHSPPLHYLPRVVLAVEGVPRREDRLVVGDGAWACARCRARVRDFCRGAAAFGAIFSFLRHIFVADSLGLAVCSLYVTFGARVVPDMKGTAQQDH